MAEKKAIPGNHPHSEQGLNLHKPHDLHVRLGCAGCTKTVEGSVTAQPKEVLSAMAGLPCEVKGAGAMWTRSGDRDCVQSLECPHEDEIFDLAEQLAQAIDLEIIKK